MPGGSKKGGGLKTVMYKKSPLYNYKSPRDYKVFNMGNKASAPFKMKGKLAKGGKIIAKSIPKNITKGITKGITKVGTSTKVGNILKTRNYGAEKTLVKLKSFNPNTTRKKVFNPVTGQYK